ncbi:NAD(P)-dependent oxidoreductase [Candidatus Pelagibacter sp.]|jgi:nucleoside-diphosphate-sugar epimerase|nr:NAD(P)-dependent oxidoreductase [Candidatus Pelagibacter sp.]
MKILVTGGAGYIGSILVPELLNLQHEVTVLDNFMFKQTSLNHLCFNKKFKIINGDIRDQKLMKSLTNSHDVIIPLAAIVGAPLCNKDPYSAQSINSDAIKDMIKNVSKDQMIIMPTTNSAYGTGDKNNFCDENSPLRPISKYAIDKVEIEKLLMSRENSISYRLATVFGMSPRMRIDLLVNDFTYRAFHDSALIIFEGHFKRNYIHIRDVVNAFIHSLDNLDKMKSEIYNVGLSDANLSKLELCEEIKKQLPNFTFVEEKIKKDPDQRNYIVSNEKIEKSGFKPKYSLSDGVNELIKGYAMLKNQSFGNF